MNNSPIKFVKTELLADDWAKLTKYHFTRQNPIGEEELVAREVYNRGNGAAALLYNKEQGTIILTRQFRLPTYVNGNDSGLMIEVCAGGLDEDHPEECIIRELKEETGYTLQSVKKVFETYMSPGSVSEKIFMYIGEYDPNMKTSSGGGLESEHEYIEVLELPFEKAYSMIELGEIEDAKTIMLLQYAKINNIFI